MSMWWMVLGGCVTLVEPEPTFAEASCVYYDTCEPAFSLLFPSVDTCVDLIDQNVALLDGCGLGPEGQQACTQQFIEGTADCGELETGACGALLSCAQFCPNAVISLVERCGLALPTELAVAACSTGDAVCFVDCLETFGCSAFDYSTNLLAVCVSQCE